MSEEELAVFIAPHHYLDNDLDDHGGWVGGWVARACGIAALSPIEKSVRCLE